MDDAKAMAIAAVEREMALLDAWDEALRLAPRSIRSGLAAPHHAEIAAAVDRLEAAVAEVRSAVA